MARRIKKMQVRFVSLVPRGANRLPTVYKSDDGTAEVLTLSKMDDEGTLTAVVYAPELRDSQDDIASADVIKDAAHNFLKNGGSIDIRHDYKPVGNARASVAETFIVQKGDERFAGWTDYDGNPVDLTGAWAMVIKIHDPELRKLYKEGGWEGVSLAGPAELEEETAKLDHLADALAAALEKRRGGQLDDEIDMKPEDLLKALEERDKTNNEVLIKGITDALVSLAKGVSTEGTPAPATPATPATPTAPVEKSAAEQMRDRAYEARKEAIIAEVEESDDPDELHKAAEALEALDQEFCRGNYAGKPLSKAVRKSAPRDLQGRSTVRKSIADVTIGDGSAEEAELSKAGLEFILGKKES